jgi:hypothetical protein
MSRIARVAALGWLAVTICLAATGVVPWVR